jgi:hypothetical protein
MYDGNLTVYDPFAASLAGAVAGATS